MRSRSKLEVHMSRYLFHVLDGRTEILYTEGFECEGLREARLHMLDIAMQEVKSASTQKDIWSIEAVNNRGLIVGSMDFGLLSPTEYRW